MVLVTTDLPATEDTRTAGKDFVVMTEGTQLSGGSAARRFIDPKFLISSATFRRR